MFCRQLAWLGATPDKAKQSRLEMINAGISLAQQPTDSNLLEDQPVVIRVPSEVSLPEVSPVVSHLKELFFHYGQCMQSGQGLLPITWQELEAFIRLNQYDMMLWEIRILKRMSDAYCSEYSRAGDPNRPAPYMPDKEEDEEQTVSDLIGKAARMREMMRKFKTRS